uniref:Uncharacterized protein n=1 Tax=Periophthalmus magnuspinnatus TaxID=409849 RepID=A0A3B4B0I4_9GOBI
MTYLSAYPKPATPKPSKPVQEPRKPVVPVVQPKPVTTPKPVKPQPQPVRPQPARDKPRSKEDSQRSGTGPSRGRFTLKNGMHCTWATQDTSNGVKMLVKCENSQARIYGGITDVQCEYNAKPQSCPAYQSNPKAYYKQVSRALKRLQGALCYEERALVKAGMCKRAPRDAHFKLDRSTSISSAHGTPADCKRPADHREVAKEYCNSSWASLCAFFFSMLQSEDC